MHHNLVPLFHRHKDVPSDTALAQDDSTVKVVVTLTRGGSGGENIPNFLPQTAGSSTLTAGEPKFPGLGLKCRFCLFVPSRTNVAGMWPCKQAQRAKGLQRAFSV